MEEIFRGESFPEPSKVHQDSQKGSTLSQTHAEREREREKRERERESEGESTQLRCNRADSSLIYANKMQLIVGVNYQSITHPLGEIKSSPTHSGKFPFL